MLVFTCFLLSHSTALPETLLLLFVILLVVLCSNAGDKLLFIMGFHPLIHRMSGRNAECYADVVLPKLSWT